MFLYRVCQHGDHGELSGRIGRQANCFNPSFTGKSREGYRKQGTRVRLVDKLADKSTDISGSGSDFT